MLEGAKIRCKTWIIDMLVDAACKKVLRGPLFWFVEPEAADSAGSPIREKVDISNRRSE